jgi:thiosulfate/3-mercaptopyruvate sulfurtransferase
VDEDVQVIAYDTDNGAMAARLWWLLKWLGHENAAVLDGGFKYWMEQKFPVTDILPKPRPKEFKPKLQNELLVTSNEMERYIQHPGYCIVDSRSEERYLGITEPIDPIAGHIPNAVNRFYMHNLSENKQFKSRDLLYRELTKTTNNSPPERAIYYCGSGVTGAHNVLAHYHAGLGMPKLYAGSWSEWIADPVRPIISKATEEK